MCIRDRVSTTRLAAAALADGDEAGAARNVGDGAAVAVLLGITYGAAVALVPALFLGPFLPQAVDARALPLAVSYTRVRALGFPAALLTVVLQSAALARRDVRTPLKAVWLGALVNAIGDYVLVARCGAGVAGAAAATVTPSPATPRRFWRMCVWSVIRSRKRERCLASCSPVRL